MRKRKAGAVGFTERRLVGDGEMQRFVGIQKCPRGFSQPQKKTRDYEEERNQISVFIKPEIESSRRDFRRMRVGARVRHSFQLAEVSRGKDLNSTCRTCDVLLLSAPVLKRVSLPRTT